MNRREQLKMKEKLNRNAIGASLGIISALINMSVVHNNLKEYDKSVIKLTEALDIAREMNDAKQMFSCYGMLSETYEKKGDIENSIKYYNLFR